MTTSENECCLRNMVARMIENPAAAIMVLLSHERNSFASVLTAAIITAMELYTWILGVTLVGVSAAYRIPQMRVKILSLGIVCGLRNKMLGNTAETTRNTVIPIARYVQIS